ncbi:MAG: tyrosine--tRNA ligase [Patescibacteria group bacterium]
MSFFKKAPAVSADSAKIRELLTRGVERVYPSAAALEKELKSGRRLSLYLGIDPTGPSLHLGHVIPLLKLRQFQELGHKVILLIGDFTATIGDPTDKLAPRIALSAAQVANNAREYKRQAARMLSFGGDNPAAMRRNSEWLNALPMTEMFALFSHVTYSQIIKRDMFQERISQGRDLNASELLYPALQGYDSVAMDVDAEVGGNDQTFNMLMGRDLLKKLRRKEKFVVAMKLLTDGAGAKMGKTEGNMVAFSDAPSDAFGKIMSWPDSMILSGFELCTTVPTSEIEEVQRKLTGGTNPKDLKLELAEKIVSLLQGDIEAKKARAQFNAAFSEGKPEEFVDVSGAGIALSLIERGVVESKSELRRLISEGAITNLDTGEKIGEEFLTTALAGKYRIGKHRFIEIK